MINDYSFSSPSPYSHSPYNSPLLTPSNSGCDLEESILAKSNNSNSSILTLNSTPSTGNTPNSSPSRSTSNTWKNINSPESNDSNDNKANDWEDYSLEIWETMPTNLPLYHPSSSLSNKIGYYPNLTPQQVNAVSLLKRKCIENHVDLSDENEHEYLKLLRFLRARKFNVDAAFNLLYDDIDWRTYKVGLDLKYETAESVLNCDVKTVLKYYPAFIQGIDKQCRPVAYRSFGNFKIWKLLEITTFDNLLRFHAWESEQALWMNTKQTRLTGYNVETFVVVVDAAGWSLNLATHDGYSFIRGMSKIDSDHYPERLGCCLVINAPMMLSIAWRIVEPFLDAVTKSKIQIMSSPSEWQPVLFSIVDRDQVPKNFGGYAPNPDIEKSFMAPIIKNKAFIRKPLLKPPPPIQEPNSNNNNKNENKYNDNGIFEHTFGENFWWLDVPLIPVTKTISFFYSSSNCENKIENESVDFDKLHDNTIEIDVKKKNSI